MSNWRRFNSLQIRSLSHEEYSNKKLQNKSICEEITSGIQLQTFPQKSDMRKLQSQTWKTDYKSSIQQPKQLNPSVEINTKEKLWPVSFIFVWTKSEQQVKHMYATQKVQIFSSLRQPETQFRCLQRHHWASALTGSTNVIQNTIITVYEVESQKSLNTKLWKRTNWLAEVIKVIIHRNFRDS